MSIDNQFMTSNNVERYRLLQNLNYNKTYKFDIRFSLFSSIQHNVVLINQSYFYSVLFGGGLVLMIYNFVFLTSFEYYLMDIYSVGFYDYKFISFDFLFGGRLVFHINNYFFNYYVYTNNLICEIYGGFERMKIYNSYDDESSQHIITPCILITSILDYQHFQIGCFLRFRALSSLHMMHLSRVVPGIIFRF